MGTSSDEKLRGPLYSAGHLPFQLTPYLPSDDLRFFVEHYWTVTWDMRDQPPYRTEHLPDTSVHLVIEAGRSGVSGVTSARFTRLVEGAGWAFCIKFRPGAFYPFVCVPISRFTDTTVCLFEIFGTAGQALEAEMLASGEEEQRVALAEHFLRSQHPARDDALALIHQIIERIVSDREITKTYHLERQFNITQRTLQRLFSRYVGVSPSWVIRRHRIHDAVTHLDQGEVIDWPALAVDLGYFDQAHFIKDFQKIIGVSPGVYARRASQSE